MSPVTVYDLVENSPSLTTDGSSIIRGSLSTTLYYIDSETGKLLKTVSDVENSEVEPEIAGTRPMVLKIILCADAENSAIILARKDYKIQSLDRESTSERWSILFGEVHLLDTSSTTNKHALMQYIHGEDSGVTYQHNGPYLTTGEDNSLHAKDPATGWNKWHVSFSSAPVVAFSLDNGGHRILEWESSSSSGSSTSEPWKKRDQRKSSRVLVGSSSGGRYALPIPSSGQAPGLGMPPSLPLSPCPV